MSSVNVFSFLIVGSVVTLAACSSGSPEPTSPIGRACTEEAKVCADGSAVSRTGPNCEFTPCPGEATGGASTLPEVSGAAPSKGECKDLCGDGTCQEVVCMAVGCPCSESKTSCPKDCK